MIWRRTEMSEQVRISEYCNQISSSIQACGTGSCFLGFDVFVNGNGRMMKELNEGVSMKLGVGGGQL